MEFKICFLALFLIFTVTEGSNNFGSLRSYIRNKINQKRSNHQSELEMLRETRHIVDIQEEVLERGLQNNQNIAHMLNELIQAAASMTASQPTTEQPSSTEPTENTTPESTATPTSETTEYSTSETTEETTTAEPDKRLVQLEEELVRELFLKKLKESLRNKNLRN